MNLSLIHISCPWTSPWGSAACPRGASLRSTGRSPPVRPPWPCTSLSLIHIYSGDNTSVIQFQDMDGDGSQETAVISFRIPGAERSLRVYFLTTQGDTERYEISAVVEGDGTGINAIDYVELSGSGKKEVVVSWRTIEGVNQLGVYSLDELESNETAVSYTHLDVYKRQTIDFLVGRTDEEA